MIAILARIVLVLGVCLGAVGAAGFAEPAEAGAWPLFLGGLFGILAGGVVLRREIRRRATAGAGGELALDGLVAELDELAKELVRLDDERDSLERRAFCDRIDALLTGPYFEIGGRNEDYARVLGPATFTRIWEGFAVSERLLARAWSIATDGHLEEARAELPRARAQLLHAAEEAARS